MKLKLTNFIACIAIFTAVEAVSKEHMSIDGVEFEPANTVIGHWLGELESITDYGVISVGLETAFIDERKLIQLVEEILNFSTTEEIHAVHIHGTGSTTAIDKITGYAIVLGDEASQRYQIQTYVRDTQQFTLDSNYSGDARGALDCASAAKLAIIHSPGNEKIVSITLGKTFYPGDTKSEDKYADTLSQAAATLARERAEQ